MSITERENLERVIFRTGEPEWVPVAPDCFSFVPIDGILAERPVLGQDGNDWFGCRWLYDAPTNGRVQDPKQPPIVSDICRWQETVHFPNLNAINWEAEAQKATKGLDRKSKMIAIKLESGIFERFHALTGFENAFIFLATAPEESQALLSAITDYRIELIHRIAQYYKPDMITNLDDYGFQTAPMMSVKMFRETIKPHLMRFGWALRKTGVIYQHHSCGTIMPLFEDILECGPQLFNLNPFNNDLDWMQKNFSDRYVITCGLHTNSVTCRTDVTESELRIEMRRAIDQLAPYKNFIAYPTALTEASASILADEARTYGYHYWSR